MKTRPTNRNSLKRISYKRNIKLRKSCSDPSDNNVDKFLCNFNNVELIRCSESLQTFWGKGKVNCMTHYVYDSKKHSNTNSKKIFHRHGVNSLKLCLFDIMNAETSEEDFISDPGEKISKNSINRMLTGWDDYGLHYLLTKKLRNKLSNANGSQPEFILSKKKSVIPMRSWIHIHTCKKCFQQFKAEWDDSPISILGLCGSKRSDTLTNTDKLNLDTNRFSLFYKSTFCYNATYNDEGNNQRFVYRNSQGEEMEELRSKMKCSEQYFRRIVYSYNTCGLHFEFPEEDDKKKSIGKTDEEKGPELNPFMRVVVYGTDPCALNFPVELGDPDGSESNSRNSATNTCPSTLKLGDSRPNGDNCQSDVLTLNAASPLTPNKSNGSIQKTNLTVSESECISQEESKNENSNAAMKKCPSLKIMGDKILNCELFDDISSLSTPENINGDQSISYSTLKSMSDSNICYSELAQFLSSSKLSGTTRTLTSGSSSDFKFLSKHSTNLRKIYHAFYPYHGKILEFSVFDTKPIFLKRNSSICYRSSKQFKKKRRTPLRLGFPAGSTTTLHSASDGKECNSSVQGPTISVNSETSSYMMATYNSLPIFLQVCIYIVFFVFCVIAYLLIQDSLTFAPPRRVRPKPQRKLFLW